MFYSGQNSTKDDLMRIQLSCLYYANFNIAYDESIGTGQLLVNHDTYNIHLKQTDFQADRHLAGLIKQQILPHHLHKLRNITSYVQAFWFSNKYTVYNICFFFRVKMYKNNLIYHHFFTTSECLSSSSNMYLHPCTNIARSTTLCFNKYKCSIA